jgi:hypothetical protein
MTADDLHTLLTHAPNHVGKSEKHKDSGTITTIINMNGTGEDQYWKMEVWDWQKAMEMRKINNEFLEYD